jgi:hypothetical protein
VPPTDDTEVYIESTANGYNEFYRIWNEAVQGRGDFEPFFAAWFESPEYRARCPEGFERTLKKTTWSTSTVSTTRNLRGAAARSATRASTSSSRSTPARLRKLSSTQVGRCSTRPVDDLVRSCAEPGQELAWT